ncbi:MAG TPA: hypothetical protein PLR52_09545 [Bacteroidales bacterium]|nr:hypothetical protein [Bacteroidales bacterium]HPF02954.1 hypothetical protein [Bacteroidales bacterium]HPI68852.1 hypothetical protein [Bacteroidales bacterium]HPR73121.1 hypothetical protein [Bacteroidales bacterium]HRW85178.1 hypothetical protein [Bacteroidales bacterium]
MKKALCFSVMLMFIAIGSCKKENSDPEWCAGVWATQVQDELTAVTNAALVYAGDPTPANCTAYKAAYQAYIDALELFSQCTSWTPQLKNEWQEALEEAENAIDTLCD